MSDEIPIHVRWQARLDERARLLSKFDALPAADRARAIAYVTALAEWPSDESESRDGQR